MTFFGVFVCFQALIFLLTLQNHVNDGFLISSSTNPREIRVFRPVPLRLNNKDDIALDVDTEREKLNLLDRKELLRLAQETSSIDRDQLPEHLDFEEVKDNLLYRKLITLSRDQLKQIAKLYHIDLRSSTPNLCERIIDESRRGSVSVTIPSSASSSSSSLTPTKSASTSITDTGVSLDKESEEILREQGLSIQDLLKLQVQFHQRGPEIFLKGKKFPSKKRFASNEEKKANLRAGPKNTAASARRDELVRKVFEEDEGFGKDLTGRSPSPPIAKKQPLVLTDDDLDKLPRRKMSKDTPDLGKLLIAPRSDVLHGVTLKEIVEELVERLGFEGLYQRTRLRFLQGEPSIATILKLLRTSNMDWARRKVEKLYVDLKQGKR